MDVLISRVGDPYIDGSSIYVNFVAIGKQGDSVLQIGFRVQYAWGLTDEQKEIAIKTAAQAAKEAYEAAHGIQLPAVSRLDILL